jgi:DNA-binding XRE family transcriptional regulator
MVKKRVGSKASKAAPRKGVGKTVRNVRTGKSAKSVAASALTVGPAGTANRGAPLEGNPRRRAAANSQDTVTLPRRDYDALIETAEDNKARRAYEASRDEESFPAEVANAILDGANPIRVWREYRGVKQNKLAAVIGVSKSHLSEVETGKSNLSVPVLSALADVLEVDMELLVPHER